MTMSPGVRKLVLATHLTVSVGWLGAVGAYLALDLTAATSQDADLVRAVWIAMGLIVSSVIVPLSLVSLLTGLVMALGTKWGLVRHWWVLISFVLTVIATLVLLSEAGVVSATAAIAADPVRSDDVVLALPPTLLHSAGGMLVLLVVQVLNVCKPQGLTPYGWRKQEAARRTRREAASTLEAQPRGSVDQ
jgi:hypothetical protein